MVAWETITSADQPAHIQDFAELWRAADKVVYSKTLETVSSAGTRIERDFDPEAVRQLKSTAGRDLAVGGPALASQAFEAGLVDELHFMIGAGVVGEGVRAFETRPPGSFRLLDTRTFDGSSLLLARYAVER